MRDYNEFYFKNHFYSMMTTKGLLFEPEKATQQNIDKNILGHKLL